MIIGVLGVVAFALGFLFGAILVAAAAARSRPTEPPRPPIHIIQTNESGSIDVTAGTPREIIALTRGLAAQPIRNCTRGAGHEGPCNGWPC